MEEVKSNPRNAIFATLTFSEESLKKLEYDEKEPNKAPQKAINLVRKRWWKKYGTPLRHWLITEMGHDNTRRIHLHGIIWTELTEEQFEKEWGYGWIFFGYEVGEKTINYIVKYVTKRDEVNPEFNGKQYGGWISTATDSQERCYFFRCSGEEKFGIRHSQSGGEASTDHSRSRTGERNHACNI